MEPQALAFKSGRVQMSIENVVIARFMIVSVCKKKMLSVMFKVL